MVETCLMAFKKHHRGKMWARVCVCVCMFKQIQFIVLSMGLIENRSAMGVEKSVITIRLKQQKR